MRRRLISIAVAMAGALALMAGPAVAEPPNDYKHKSCKALGHAFATFVQENPKPGLLFAAFEPGQIADVVHAEMVDLNLGEGPTVVPGCEPFAG